MVKPRGRRKSNPASRKCLPSEKPPWQTSVVALLAPTPREAESIEKGMPQSFRSVWPSLVNVYSNFQAKTTVLRRGETLILVDKQNHLLIVWILKVIYRIYWWKWFSFWKAKSSPCISQMFIKFVRNGCLPLPPTQKNPSEILDLGKLISEWQPLMKWTALLFTAQYERTRQCGLLDLHSFSWLQKAYYKQKRSTGCGGKNKWCSSLHATV